MYDCRFIIISIFIQILNLNMEESILVDIYILPINMIWFQDHFSGYHISSISFVRNAPLPGILNISFILLVEPLSFYLSWLNHS